MMPKTRCPYCVENGQFQHVIGHATGIDSSAPAAVISRCAAIRTSRVLAPVVSSLGHQLHGRRTEIGTLRLFPVMAAEIKGACWFMCTIGL